MGGTMYHYSDETRESDAYSLPDVEVFQVGAGELTDSDGEPCEAGWYYAFGFPGCLWDGDPIGPFQSEAEALADAREGLGDDN